MSNTLNLGTDGNWAVKKDSLLAYNSENGNFKPLPFDFTRASSATVVNKDGLIETVGSGKARIDFKDDAKGALLLEPSRTNLIQYSESFDNAYWTKSGSSVTSGFVSPKGDLSAFKLTEDTSNGEHKITRLVLTTNQRSEASFFVKSNGRNKVVLSMGTTTFQSTFDLSNGTFINDGDSLGSIESLKNDWYKISINSSYFSATDVYATIKLLNNSNNVSYIGDGTSGIYLFGAQLEQGSYATSYIPTQAGAVTRVADSSSQTPPIGIIGQTEGTMFLNIKRGVQINNTQGLFGISSASGDNRIIIWNIFTLNSLGIQIKANGANIITSQSLGVFNNGENYKIAVSYKSGEIKGYVNGLQIFNLTNTFTFTSALSEIYLNNYANNSFTEISPINELQIYNTALSNAELIALTQ